MAALDIARMDEEEDRPHPDDDSAAEQEEMREQEAPPTDPVYAMSLADISALMGSACYAKSRISELQATADAECERVRAWCEQATQKDRERVAFVTAQCEQFMLQRRAEDRGAKSFTTPYGTITSREQQPEYVRDDEALRAWAGAHGWLREAKPQPSAVDWAKLKEEGAVVDGRLIVDGEPVAGVTVVPRAPSVVVAVDSR